jgi:autotransporter translocation and assembly factor TamB
MRRLVRVLVVTLGLALGIVTLALLGTQTSWFKDWLRRYIVRESAQYLNGELHIGRLSGTLLGGVALSDVTLTQDGQTVIAFKDINVDYSVLDLVSQGIVLDEIELNQPNIVATKTGDGWNLMRLVKKQAEENKRRGPGRPVTIKLIRIHDGRVRVDRGGNQPVTEITKLDTAVGFRYVPVSFTVDIGRITFRASNPSFTLSELSGVVKVAGPDITLQRIYARLPESEFKIDGAVRSYKETPRLDLSVVSSKLTFPEIGPLLPAVRHIQTVPSFTVKVKGPLSAIETTLDLKSGAGSAAGNLTLDFASEKKRIDGDLQVREINLAPWIDNQTFKGLITGRAQFALTLPDSAKNRPFGGTFHFTGPRAGAAGYAAENVDARGHFEGAHVTVEQARGQAYGAAVTATGTIGPGQAGKGVQYQFKGHLADLDLRLVPRTVPIPPLASQLDLDYDVHGEGSEFFRGDAAIHPSTVEGLAIAEGMQGYFELNHKQIAYGGEGDVSRVDLPRLGRALDVDALTAPRFEGVVNGHFRVEASGKSLADLVLHATGTAVDSSLFGGAKFHKVEFDTTIDRAALTAKAKGSIGDLNPVNVIDKPWLKGALTGTVDGTVTIPDLREDVTTDTFGFEGTATLTAPSTYQGLAFERVEFTGGFAHSVLRVDHLAADGPDVRGTASGTVAFDETSQSNLAYDLTAPDLARLGKMVNQPIAGVLQATGTLTGNASELATTGHAHATDFQYEPPSAAALEAAAKAKGATQTTAQSADVEAPQAKADVKVADADYAVTLPKMDVALVKADATLTAETLHVAGREVATLTGKAGYQAETKQAQFDASILEGPRTVDAAGTVQLQDDTQEIHLSKFSLAAEGVTWQMTPGTQPVIVYNGRRVRLADVSLTNGPQHVAANGGIAVAEDETYDLKVEAKALDVAQLQTLAGMTTTGIGGVLDASATVFGPAADLKADGSFDVTQGSYRDVKFESFKGTAKLADRRIGVDVKLVQAPGAELTAVGALPLAALSSTPAASAAKEAAAAASATTPAASRLAAVFAPAENSSIDLRVQSSTVDLALAEGLTDAITGITGTAKVDVRVTGQLREPKFEGSAQIDNGAFTVAATGSAYNGLNAALRFEPSRLVIDRFKILDDGNDPLDVTGELGLEENRLGAMKIAAVAKNFEVLDNYFGVVDVNANLSVNGELLRPVVRGTIDFHTGRVEVDEVLRKLTSGAYSTRPQEEGGAAAPVPAAVTPTATPAAPAAPAPAATATAAPSATPPSATMPSAAVATETAIAAAAAQKPAAAASKADADRLGPWDGLDLDVQVKIPDNLVLRGKDLRTGPTSIGLGNMNVTVGGNLRLIKQPGDPMALIGTVNTVRGTYDFKGRRFDLLRDGRIAFQGGDVGNPTLDVSAQRVIQPSGIEARIKIQGTARRPQLSFSSTPPLDESDVIALIVFNRPLNSLQSGQQASIAEFAGATAAGFVVSPLTESLGRALNLDLFEVQTTTDVGTGGTVTIGQQIGEDIFFKFRQQFGSQEVSEFILEYQFTRFLRLAASHAEGEGVGRPTRSLANRIQRDGIDLIFYFSY